MCCFTGRVEVVARTKIFARASSDARQFLVYSMTLSAKDDLAMVLPLPVPKDSPEKAVEFINLEKYSDFFRDMNSGFPVAGGISRGAIGGVRAPQAAPLEVVEVGSFEASFVPRLADFTRLDERFRFSSDVWSKLPQYLDYGFAVFKLKKGKHDVHPMAFEFPRRDPKLLFFPTVHIHDGEVHPRADFDHDLFLQPAGETQRVSRGWLESGRPAEMFMDMEKAKGIIAADMHCYRWQIKGQYKNTDTFV